MLNRFLRTAPTRTLLGAIAGFVAVIAGGTAIALAAQGSGPVPKPKALAAAVRSALNAPPVQGVTAHVNFTNGLIGTSEIQGTDPLLQGGQGQIWVSDNGQFRLELYGDNGDPELVVNRHSWWLSDPTLQTVYEGTLPSQSGQKSDSGKAQKHSLPSIAQIQADLNQLAQHLNLSRAIPSDVGGQPTYTIRMSPKQSGGLVGQVQLAWDAIRGVPLRFAVYARGDRKPVLQLEATNVSYGPQTGVFNLTRPAGYRVVNVATPSSAGASSDTGSKATKHGEHSHVTGVQAVAKHLSFKLAAPATLGGMQRSSVSLLGASSHAGALVLYGQGLGGIAVMEQPATASSSQQLQLSSQQGDHQRGLSLPSFSVHGATAQELDTALGTFVRFTANGVTYTIIGSVKSHTARAAARGL